MKCESLGAMLLLFTLAALLTCCQSLGATDPPPQAPSVCITPASICLVPDVVSQEESAAARLVAGSGLQPVRSLEYNGVVPRGTVMRQTPAAGTRLEPCSGEVVLVISHGLRALFLDDFEGGIRPEWGMSGNGYFAVNGRLTAERAVFESQIIEEPTLYQNYQLRLIGLEASPGVQILVRAQDGDNYMSFRCDTRSTGAMSSGDFYHWVRVIRGEAREVPDTAHRGCGKADLVIEVSGNMYRTYIDGQKVVYFSDDSFSAGGFSIRVNTRGKFALDAIEVVRLP